ncbi:hypothetical protein QR685DRAFT_533561 [Neurospora intermedia]|uniref:Uncharacterized protein n=1 Tax=Neurospora intermedia TaxID=5142 RepID=A0ABR3D3B2_NEUIN
MRVEPSCLSQPKGLDSTTRKKTTYCRYFFKLQQPDQLDEEAVPCCCPPKPPELPEAECHSNRNGVDTTARTPCRVRNNSYRRTRVTG